VNIAPNLWSAPDPTLWPDEAIPERTRDDWRVLAGTLEKKDDTDRARMIRAKARGGVWYCPGACTGATGPDCDCPCGRACHGRTCTGH
jgi:hypothetical protein